MHRATIFASGEHVRERFCSAVAGVKSRTEAESGMKTVRSARPTEEDDAVLILWAVPAVLVLGGGIYLIGHMH